MFKVAHIFTPLIFRLGIGSHPFLSLGIFSNFQPTCPFSAEIIIEIWSWIEPNPNLPQQLQQWNMGQIAILKNAFLTLILEKPQYLITPKIFVVRILNSGRKNDHVISSTAHLRSSWGHQISQAHYPRRLFRKSRCQTYLKSDETTVNWWSSPQGTKLEDS